MGGIGLENDVFEESKTAAASIIARLISRCEHGDEGQMEGAVATSCDSVLGMESMIGRNSFARYEDPVFGLCAIVLHRKYCYFSAIRPPQSRHLYGRLGAAFNEGSSRMADVLHSFLLGSTCRATYNRQPRAKLQACHAAGTLKPAPTTGKVNIGSQTASIH
jgi:hypothetical protein